MSDGSQLWNKRFHTFWKEAAGYLRYVFNSGFLVFVMFSFIVGGYYYSKLVDSISPSFPIEWIIVPVLTLFISIGSVRTFLDEADLVFVIPMEWRMGDYFRRSFMYSFIWKAFFVLFLLGLLQPLYVNRFGANRSALIMLGAFLVLVTFLNVLAGWIEQRLHSRQERLFYRSARWFMTFILLFSYIRYGIHLYFLIVLVLYLLPFWHYGRLRKQNLNWVLLLEIEKNKEFRFYHTINWFVDVPYLQNRIKERRWLPRLTNWLPFEKDYAYHYLTIKSFSRANELFDMVVRLWIFSAALLLLAAPHQWGQWLIIAMSLVMAHVQMASLRKHHVHTIWVRLYPLPPINRNKAVNLVVFTTLLLQAVILSIVSSFYQPSYAIAFGTTLLFSVLFVIFLAMLTSWRKQKSR